jgi:hypothetical protein
LLLGELSMVDRPVLVKGSTIGSTIAYIEQNHGTAGIARVSAECSPETQALLASSPYSMARYPLTVLVDLLCSCDRAFGAGDLQLCWEIGKFAGAYEATIFHKAVIQVGRIHHFLRLAGFFWGFYYSAGSMIVSASAPTSAAVQLRDFDPISKVLCYRVGGWIHGTAQLFGHADVSVEHTACVLDGAAYCEWTGSWQAK